MRIPPATWKFIEQELYNFDYTKQEIESLREDVISTSAPPVNAGGKQGPGDPTSGKVVKLMSSPALAQMERTVRAIEKAFTMLSEDHLLVYELKYRQGLSWQRVCTDAPMSRRAYFKLRRELVLTVGANLGLIQLVQDVH